MNTKGLKVKANIKKHFVCGGVILLCYVYLLTHEISDAEVYGFWAGLWQGGIFLPKFIISLFLDNVKFIAKNRTLGYDIAFFFVIVFSLNMFDKMIETINNVKPIKKLYFFIVFIIYYFRLQRYKVLKTLNVSCMLVFIRTFAYYES